MARRWFFGHDQVEFSRSLSFFDAIYGVSITLLIFGIEVPPPEAWQSIDTLLADGLGTQLVSFVISFAVIAYFWMGNATLLSSFSAIDGAVIAANLVAAGFMILIPFTTHGISDRGISDLPLPTALYALNLAFAFLSEELVFEVGRMRGFLSTEVTRRMIWVWRADTVAKIAVLLLSIPIAYYAGAVWGRVSWLGLIVVSLLIARRGRRIAA